MGVFAKIPIEGVSFNLNRRIRSRWLWIQSGGRRCTGTVPAAAWPRLETEEGERRFIFPSLFFLIPKQIQNEILTQFKIRLQTKQYKILCNSMNAHSLLLNLYLVLFLIKLLFPKFKFPQNAELIIFSYFKKYEKIRVLH